MEGDGVCSGCLRWFSSARRMQHCRNCGTLVCSSCSKRRWPSAMVTENNINNVNKLNLIMSITNKNREVKG